MRRKNSVVRTRTIYDNGDYYEIELMTYEEYLVKLTAPYYFSGVTFKLYPYRWYQYLWCLVDYPYYFLFKPSKATDNNSLRINGLKATIKKFLYLLVNFILAFLTRYFFE